VSGERDREAGDGRRGGAHGASSHDPAGVPDDLDLLDALLDAEGVAPSVAAITRRGATRAPLSPAQKRLAFLHTLDPASMAYTISGAVRMQGDLDVDALEAAFGAVVARHASLRTTFEGDLDDSEDLVQIVHDAMAVRVVRSQGDGATAKDEAARAAERLLALPWDLAKGPLLRAAIVALGPDDHLLVVVLHHIVADGWSIGIFLRDLGALYRARIEGTDPGLADLPIEYTDYAAWLREHPAAGRPEVSLAYWRAHLAGAPERLDLPLDRPRPAFRHQRGALFPFRISAELTRALETLAQREGATLYMVLLATFQALLARWSGQTDIVVGAPIAGRDRAGTETLVGLFVNTLVLRTDLSGDPAFRDLLARARSTALGAYAHQDTPFEQLVEELRPERSLDHMPLFQVMFAFQDAPTLEELAMPGIAASAIEIDTGTAQFELSLNVHPEAGGIAGSAEYDTDLFDASTIGRMLAHYRRLLEAIARGGGERLSGIPLLDPEERRTALEVWSGRSEILVGERLFHERFEEHARAHPQRIAAVLGSRRVTYGTIDERSARLAARLVSMGAGPERRVGLCLPRGPELAIGMLATLRAGAAFVPLDPAHPRDRLSFVRSDAQVRIVLAVAETLLDAGSEGIEVVRIDDDGAFAETPLRTSYRPAPESLAYIIYTSGTTGRPKGVMIEQGSVAAALRAWERLYDLASTRSHLQMAGLGFAVCTADVVRALGSGGTLVFCERETVLDPARLFDLARRERVEFAEFVPAVLRELAGEARARGDRLDDVRIAVAASDSWSSTEIGPFRATFGPNTWLANGYGVTEGTNDSTLEFVRDHDVSGASPPIGRPLTDTAIYVLDGAMEPVPAGVIGDIYLGGPAIARGYAGRPALTAERFVPDPFGTPGSRLYRTGDRARHLADGRLVFCGRVDDQVKIRGQRIEPAEVEAVMTAQTPTLAGCAVVARPDRTGALRLVAYVVAGRGAALDVESLRQGLEGRLPAAMVPYAIVVLPALPLSPNGKVDRRRLPEPEWDSRETYTAPRTAAEEAVAAAYADVLGLDRVGAHDEFFALGGHSLVATRVVSRLRAKLGVEVPLRAIFEAPRVRDLALRVEALRDDTSAQREVAQAPLRRAPDAERAKPSYAQWRLWFLDRLEPDSAAYNIANAVRIDGPLDSDAVERALSAVVERHEALRTRFPEGEDGPIAVLDPPSPIRMVRDDLTLFPESERDAEVQRRLELEARSPFDLARGPVLRARLMRLAPGTHVLALVVHHIASDGWSMGVMIADLAAAYATAAGGATPRLAPLEVQYADWAAWQRARLESGERERQLAYWRGELAGLEPLALPLDRRRPVRSTGAGGAIDVSLPAGLVTRLSRVARDSGATMYMALLAAYAAVLSRWSGQRDIGIGTPVANRTREEVEGMVGFFVNSLVVRVRLDGTDAPIEGAPSLPYRSLLSRVRGTALGAYANQDVPFERVVEELRPERDLTRTPLFQVMFALQNAPMGALDLGGATLTPIDAPTRTSTFDMTLSLAPASTGDGFPRTDAEARLTASPLEGFLEYSTELFDETTMRRFWGHLVRLLETVADDPGVDVHRARLLGDEERDRAVRVWSGTGDLLLEGPFLHERFLAHATSGPERLATVDASGRASYGEIAARSAHLATLLSTRGVGPESRVGICLPRSADFVVAVMGVLRAGGAFVPLDPDHPRDRNAFVLDDAGARIVLATRATATFLEGSGAAIVLIEEVREEDASFPRPPGPGASVPPLFPGNLAYVVYTSGTTGRPKGVMVSHGSLATAIAAWEKLYGLSASGRHLQMAGAAFDVCTGDVARALGSGGALVFCGQEQLLDPAALFDLAARERVDQAEFVPAVLRELATEARGRSARLEDVRIAIVASDVWTSAEIAEFRAVFGEGARLANGYGVTEATIDSTCAFLGDAEAGWASPPIGRPLGHATVYVLDAAHEPVPCGVAGELYIGGPGVARGYVGRPDLTAERYVPDPFGTPGSRLYRTGDRARYLADGRITFAGRIDDQVKIRGLRIEPREVEAALAAEDAIAACAVVARRDPGGVLRLVAYVAPRPGAPLDPDALRGRLRLRLPEAMVPSAIAILDALPLTPNAKVDRRALPEPGWDAHAVYEPPNEGAESLVAAVFAEVLSRERIGAGDDFFALGGHSLLATRVVSRLRAALGVEVPLRTLFESPTVRALAARIASFDGSHAPPPVRRARDDERRLASYAQRRLWFLDRLEPESAAYNLPSSVRISGALDVAALAGALSAIVRRHEPLRTRFAEGSGGPQAVVDPPSAVPLPVIDLAAMEPAARDEEVRARTQAEARAPFDLARGPLLRAVLLRLADDEYRLLVTVAHIAADGWSLGILLSELGALYAAAVRGEESPLAPLEIAYADWAAWQRAWLESGEGDRQLAWWRENLAGVPPLSLPLDRPRPARPAWRGASLPITLSARVHDGLARIAREERTTLHAALLAGYGLALGRWSQQKDLAIGTPVANRRTVEAEALIGFFVNTLAVRVRLDGRGLTFRGLVDRAREATLGAHAHEDVPFERVVEELAPERRLGHNPVIQTLFALQNAPAGEAELPGLTLAYEEPETGVTRFDVELFLAETPSGLEGIANYATELFDEASVLRFLENFSALLEAVVLEPDTPLASLPALAPEQERQVRALGIGARIAYPDPPLVHALTERRAARDPSAFAVRHGSVRMTYGELNARANRLARHLRHAGAGPETLVAVCLERSCDVLVALLGILKAGAAYVPVDPEYPRERIALILEDAGASLAVTQASLAERVARVGTRAVRIDAEWESIAREDGGDLGLDIPPDALAYSVYTSGSTGHPKGVAMSHRAISNMLAWQQRDSAVAAAPDRRADSNGIAGHGWSAAASPARAPRTLQFASLSFDVSFQEIFSTLGGGGEIVLVSEDERRDAPRLLRLIAETGVERLFLPFVALDQIAGAAVSEGIVPASLREIDTAGEQLRITPAIAAFFARLPQCRLVNHYGPSEAHLVTTFELTGDPALWDALPSIGRPIANASVHLLDDEGHPVPLGAPGELYVGGAGLARGYHERSDLTAERFVPSPLPNEPGARLYRTGDIARLEPGGRLVFLGRRDLQVKIRGYRVEPGEIEAALVRHPAVRQAAVVAREARGGKRLAAYVVLDPATEASSASGEVGISITSPLRTHLASSLPEYMVPAAIVVLDALPLTPNGKVDRAALPEPEWGAVESGIRPRTPEEDLVCGIFAEVLGLPRAGTTDNFFDLGGHSLLATQVVSRVRRSLGVELPLRVLFETPTPAAIAAEAVVLRRRGAPAPPPLRPADAGARRKPSFAQMRLWFLHALEPSSAVYNLPAAMRIEGRLDKEALARALATLAERHEALRTRFVQGPDGPEAMIDEAPAREEPAGGRVAASESGAAPMAAASGRVSVEDLQPRPGEPADDALVRVLAEEATRPFDLEAGPVLRTRLLRLGPETHVLSLVAHHIAADGWSLGILVREIGALYEAYAAGRPSPLLPLRVAYADWAAWQREWLAEGEEEARQLAWWREELRGAPPALTLPSDRARPSRLEGLGAMLEVRLAAPLVARLSALARAEGATLHMALLAGYAWILLRHAGQEEIVVGTPVANRRAAEAEELVGFFVNTLAVRVRAGGAAPGFRGLLARVREASLGAYANQDVPFERVVEEIQPERALNRAPLFQTAFALQNARLPRAALSGLTMIPVEVDTGTSKFDLMLIVEETEEGGLEGAFEYSTELFDRDTIAAIAGRLGRFLEEAVAAPDVPLDALMLAGPDEESRVLAMGNVAPAGGGEAVLAVRDAGTETIPELLPARIARTIASAPGAPAIGFEDEIVDYATLGERAGRLARALRTHGAGPERCVAVLLERSPDAIVAMLAVFEAGAVWVPLDPAQPPDRLRFQVEDCGASILISRTDIAVSLEVGEGLTAVLLDRDGESIAGAPDLPPGPSARPENLAYIIYTSGSTGRPKGVGVEHRQLAAYVDTVIDRLGIVPGLRWALVSTLAADLGHTAIFPALATGGCLDILPQDIALDAPAAERWFSTRSIDAMKIVPSHLQALSGGDHPARVLPRRLLVLGGEGTPGSRLETFSRLAPPGCRIAIHYGPTEATVGAVAGFPTPADAGRALAPLGRPLERARVVVLDSRGRPVPAGVPGEVFLGGAGVARGYPGRPDLTAERFVPDPFAAEPGSRLYRTGDRARWLADGRLEFLGRADGQVKVRGWRIETGEVAAVLESAEGVRRAAVVVREDAASGPGLAAYVVADPRVAQVVHGLARRTLPEGVAVAELNRNETDYLHREIFGLRAYARHGITIRPGDTIVDAGANIGLFSIFAALVAPGVRLFACEPNPVLQPILRANLAAYAPGAVPIASGLSDRARDASFTFFPGFSLLSGLHADAGTEKAVVRSYLENLERGGETGAGDLAREAEVLLAERFEGRTMEVRLRTLSDVIAEHAIERIHLLKVNVEKAELELLRGIHDEDWSRIDQAVVEVDVAESLEPILALFAAHGFETLVEQDPLLARTELRYVYAARRGSGRALAPGAPPPPAPSAGPPLLTADALRAHARRMLPEPMVPSSWTFLDTLPLTPNGKLDRALLPEPRREGASFAPPRGEVQKTIAAIWSEALGVPRVGIHENFFDLGGHSLLLARVHASLREALGADLTIVDLFRYPTIESLARRLAEALGPSGRRESAPAGATGPGAAGARGARRRETARVRARLRSGGSPGGGGA
jgi:amino acid adenylation domain-containing protein/FkbM family methyltransferase